MDVVVFGATGYLGSHAAEQLMIAGHAVKCIVRPQSDTHFLQSIAADIHVVDFANGDLSALIDEGSCVLNCTADTRMHLSDLQRSKVEIDLTTQIFKAAAGAGAGVRRLDGEATAACAGADALRAAADAGALARSRVVAAAGAAAGARERRG